MQTRSSLNPWVLSGLLLALAPACSSSDKTALDAAVPIPDGARPEPKDSAVEIDGMAPAIPDAPAADRSVVTADTGTGADTSPSDGVLMPGLDVRIGDAMADMLGGDLGPSTKDSSPDQSVDGFDPGPVVPIIVNSGPTGSYNLANGTWKVFSFDAEANQVYSISGLGGGVNGYLGPTASVSPTNSQAKTNSDGNLSFVAPAAQKYFLAVAAQGVGASGSFQVADGGRLLAMGKQTFSLTAPTGDDYAFFHFPIASGHAYGIVLEGQSATSVGLGLSARAERASNRQFSYALRGVSGPLPMTEDIPATSVAESYSGFYYLFLRISVALSVSITVTQTP
jgi:hypothetical protein